MGLAVCTSVTSDSTEKVTRHGPDLRGQDPKAANRPSTHSALPAPHPWEQKPNRDHICFLTLLI